MEYIDEAGVVALVVGITQLVKIGPK